MFLFHLCGHLVDVQLFLLILELLIIDLLSYYLILFLSSLQAFRDLIII